MPVEIQAQGFVGIAFETTWGTPVAPTKFFPIRSEDLNYTQDTQWRRPIRGVADNLGGIPGFNHVAGSIEMELMENILPYFLYVSRYSVTKDSTNTPDLVYTATPTHWGSSASLPTGKKGLTITVVRAGQVFAYTGCVCTGIELSTDNGIPIVTFEIIGRSEAAAVMPTYVEDAASIPFGANHWTLEIPTSSQIFDADGLTVNVNNNGEAIFRLGSVSASFVKWGERTVTASMDRDFADRTEYDAFKLLTETSCMVKLERSAENYVSVTLPRAVPETYEPTGLSSQGDLVRATAQYQGAFDGSGSAAAVWEVGTQEDIT